ncbi:MAG: DMT family transporter [Hyphomicrobiales bacterium]
MTDAVLNKQNLAPLVVMAVGIFALSIMDALVKVASADIQTWQIVVLRYGFGSISALAYYLYQNRAASKAVRSQPLFSANTLKTSLLRAVFILLTASSFFYALGNLPLAQAVTIAFSAPLFMVLFSRLLLGEQISGYALFAIALGFSGVLVIFGGALLQPLEGAFVPMTSALMASIFYSLAIVLSRKHSSHTKPEEMVLLQTTFALLLVLPFGLLPFAETDWTAPEASGWLLFVVIGILGTFGHVLMVWALARETASRLGPIEYTNLLWAVMLGAVLFDEWPDWRTLIGALLVILGCILAGRSKSVAVR